MLQEFEKLLSGANDGQIKDFLRSIEPRPMALIMKDLSDASVARIGGIVSPKARQLFLADVAKLRQNPPARDAVAAAQAQGLEFLRKAVGKKG